MNAEVMSIELAEAMNNRALGSLSAINQIGTTLKFLCFVECLFIGGLPVGGRRGLEDELPDSYGVFAGSICRDVSAVLPIELVCSVA